MKTILLLLVIVPSLVLAEKLSNRAEPTFLYSVSGCAGSVTGTATRAFSSQQVVEPKIEISSDSIRYVRAGGHQCCRKVVVQSRLEKGRITLTEFWTGAGCRCMCFSDIAATVSNLTAGDYDVAVYSSGVEPNSDKIIEPKMILSQKVRVGSK